MSLGFVGVHQLLPALSELSEVPNARVLLLGTQDLTFTYDQAVSFFRLNGVKFHEIAKSDRKTSAGFGYVSNDQWREYQHFLHQDSFFKMLGISPEGIDTLDVSDFENANIIHDLNLPMEAASERYDLIINQGTLEHVFDIRQALWTLSDLMRVGGQIVHMAPAGFLDHGFYNFNATLFSDFYEQAGWRREELYYCLFPKNIDGNDQSIYAACDPGALSTIPEDYYINVHARYRKTEQSVNTFAAQSFYVNIHDQWRGNRRRSVDADLGPDAVSRQEAWFRDLRKRHQEKMILSDLTRLSSDVRHILPLSGQENVAETDIDVVKLSLGTREFFHEGGFAWRCGLHEVVGGDMGDTPNSSLVVILEDGQVIGSPHALHADIRQRGKGRYSHWNRDLYFSTSDNSSPILNGRVYEILMPRHYLECGTKPA